MKNKKKRENENILKKNKKENSIHSSTNDLPKSSHHRRQVEPSLPPLCATARNLHHPTYRFGFPAMGDKVIYGDLHLFALLEPRQCLNHKLEVEGVRVVEVVFIPGRILMLLLSQHLQRGWRGGGVVPPSE